jgi:glycosyltransferase involved in cell wall biosynthesis
VGFNEDVRPFLEASDVFVSPSDQEGFGLSLVEAMAYSLPCVASNIGGHNEIVVQEDTGFLVKPGSVEELAQAIKYLIIHREERCRMGRNGRRRVQERFDLETSMEAIKNVLFERV